MGDSILMRVLWVQGEHSKKSLDEMNRETASLARGAFAHCSLWPVLTGDTYIQDNLPTLNLESRRRFSCLRHSRIWTQCMSFRVGSARINPHLAFCTQCQAILQASSYSTRCSANARCALELFY